MYTHDGIDMHDRVMNMKTQSLVLENSNLRTHSIVYNEFITIWFPVGCGSLNRCKTSRS